MAIQQPAITKANPMTVATVMSSSRNTAPSATATTGLANVMSPGYAKKRDMERKLARAPKPSKPWYEQLLDLAGRPS